MVGLVSRSHLSQSLCSASFLQPQYDGISSFLLFDDESEEEEDLMEEDVEEEEVEDDSEISG